LFFRNFRVMTEETKDAVNQILTDYLEAHKHRKTSERFAILNEIYSHDGHFDIENLYLMMKNKRYRVSRATLYNNIEILLDAGLVIKHQFGKNLAQFEKAYKYKQHDHLICNDCERVLEFCDPRIMQIQKMTEDLLNFEVTHHSLNFFAKCKDLKETGKCVHYKQ
jgi:Fur family transcriptional regulator, ferric uptake regulator